MLPFFFSSLFSFFLLGKKKSLPSCANVHNRIVKGSFSHSFSNSQYRRSHFSWWEYSVKTCVCYSSISWLPCYSFSSLLDARKATEKEEFPPQNLKSICQPSPNYLSFSYHKWGAKGDYELSCHICRPFFNFRTLNFIGMISDVQQQQEEEHSWSQESLGMQSLPPLDATSPTISAVSTNSLDWCNLFSSSPSLSQLPPQSSLLNPYKSVQNQFSQASLSPSTNLINL